MKKTKRSVYIESSVISYLTARRSKDIIIAAYQEITKDWWEQESAKYDCYVSDFVIDEISRGDYVAASERLKAVKGFKKLGLNETVHGLIAKYKEYLSIPEKSVVDLFHLAISVGNGIDYVLSWNFKHIANAHIREKLQDINEKLGLRTPVICTPEELIGEENE
jgi:hypothetical protein